MTFPQWQSCEVGRLVPPYCSCQMLLSTNLMAIVEAFITSYCQHYRQFGIFIMNLRTRRAVLKWRSQVSSANEVIHEKCCFEWHDSCSFIC